jgi:hypothetical protein
MSSGLWRHVVLQLPFTLKVEAENSSETLVSYHNTPQHHISEELDFTYLFKETFHYKWFQKNWTDLPIMRGDWNTTATGRLATILATTNRMKLLAVKTVTHLPMTRVITPRNSTGRRPILKHNHHQLTPSINWLVFGWVTAWEHHVPLTFHSGLEADHSPPSSAEVKEWVELYLHSTHTPSWRGAQLGGAQVFTHHSCVVTKWLWLQNL